MKLVEMPGQRSASTTFLKGGIFGLKPRISRFCAHIQSAGNF